MMPAPGSIRCPARSSTLPEPPLRRRRKFPYCDMDTGKATSTKTPTRHLQHGPGRPPPTRSAEPGPGGARVPQAPTGRVPSPHRARAPAGPARAHAGHADNAARSPAAFRPRQRLASDAWCNRGISGQQPPPY